MKAFNIRLTDEAWDDLLAMAKFVGKPNNLAAGFYAIIAEWRRLKAAHEARLDRAAHIAAQEERLDAMDRRADAEGRGY